MSWSQQAKRLVPFLAIWLLAGCSTPPAAGPLPTPQSIRVAYPPSLKPVSAALHACAVTQPQVALLVDEQPPGSLDVGQADLSLWLGAPPGADLFAAPLAKEEIVAIVHPQNPVSSLKSGQLQLIFSGEISNWQMVGGDNLPIQVWVYPQGNELRSLFEAVVLPGSRLTTLARLAPAPETMLEAISMDRAAIGYLPLADLNDKVKRIQLDAQLEENLSQPVIALASREPEGTLRAFLVCLQSGAGQKELKKIYGASR